MPVTMAAQVQRAADCYNAGAIVLHMQVREADGKGSRRVFMFNECWIACAPPCRRRRCKWGSKALSSSSTFSIFTFQPGYPSS
ncbi:3-keto-5-aminohexanoate cleavage protein [Cupriavidus sp. 2MCAB6]|uniref:3-keto-5-aminohexanoate cleavage protein n=1 Tax=Cupriavidus sp. 2MCAB6 TaxID=3232981 RepID=UPI003F92EE2D